MIEKLFELIKQDEINYPNDRIPYYDSTDYIFDTLDDLLLEGKFKEVGDCFKESIPYVKNFPSVIMLAYLSVTNYPGNSELNNRSEFYEECEKVLKERGETEEKIQRRLGGFKNR